MIKDFINLIYPNLCCLCGEPLPSTQTKWCLSCDLKLPKTHFGSLGHNTIYQALTGQWSLEFALSSYYFKKGNAMQTLLHQLKYRGKIQLGHQLGEKMANDLIKLHHIKPVDIVLPVPLHPSKLLTRGYNQAEVLGKPIADRLKCQLPFENMRRTRATQTQTKKARYTRWENVDSIFHISKPLDLENKHVLLVDDVFTTGATIGGCLNVLSEIKGIKMSVATLAIADY